VVAADGSCAVACGIVVFDGTLARTRVLPGDCGNGVA